MLVVSSQLVADSQPLFIFAELCKLRIVGQLLPSRLHCEISLAVGDDRFAGVAILHDQVTGVAREAHIRQFTPRTGTNLDHFEDILEMVCYRLTTVEARLASTVHHGQKMAILRIVQHLGQRTCQPEFIALVIRMLDAFKGCVVLIGYFLIAHDHLFY